MESAEKGRRVSVLVVACGTAVGFSLGLTGGGGGILAVPLLVYGLGIPSNEAIGVSTFSVGCAALSGVIRRLYRGTVELRIGLFLAMGSMIGGPLGRNLGADMPPWLLMSLLSILMVLVAHRMWTRSNATMHKSASANGHRRLKAWIAGVCQRDADGKMPLTFACVGVFLCVGLAIGVMAGMFGIGGGFLIVPTLVILGRMPMHAAIGTALLVIFLTSSSVVASIVWRDDPMAWNLALQFSLGGLFGMQIGTMLARRLSSAHLQRIFAIVIVVVAVITIVKTVKTGTGTSRVGRAESRIVLQWRERSYAALRRNGVGVPEIR